jgi:hypothetical protein
MPHGIRPVERLSLKVIPHFDSALRWHKNGGWRDEKVGVKKKVE